MSVGSAVGWLLAVLLAVCTFVGGWVTVAEASHLGPINPSQSTVFGLDLAEDEVHCSSPELTAVDDIDVSGGSLLDPNGVELKVPDGLLAATHRFAVYKPEVIPRATATDRVGYRIVRAVEVAGSEREFAGDVEISIPYSDGDFRSGLAAFHYDRERGLWEFLGGTVDSSAKKIRFQTTHLSLFGLGVPVATGVDQRSGLLFAMLAIVGGIALMALTGWRRGNAWGTLGIPVIVLAAMFLAVESSRSPSVLAHPFVEGGTPIPHFHKLPTDTIVMNGVDYYRVSTEHWVPSDGAAPWNQQGDWLTVPAVFRHYTTAQFEQERTAAGIQVLGPSDIGYDCHGFTFAGGSFWIDDDWVPTILEARGYHTVALSDAVVGDVVVYHGPGTYRDVVTSARNTAPRRTELLTEHFTVTVNHSGIVDDLGPPLHIYSKWGESVLAYHGLMTVPGYGPDVTVYRP